MAGPAWPSYFSHVMREDLASRVLLIFVDGVNTIYGKNSEFLEHSVQLMSVPRADFSLTNVDR